MQIDYFGLASTAYALLSGSYLKLGRDKSGRHFPQGSFRRWWNTALWTDFFTAFLNIPNERELPDLLEWRARFAEAFVDKRPAFEDAVQQIRGLGIA